MVAKKPFVKCEWFDLLLDESIIVNGRTPFENIDKHKQN
jgi:hypothetical protein